MSKPKSLFSKWFKVFLLAAVLAGVIYLIFRNIDTFGNVLLVLLGFGTVILVHEFGHFISAKLCGIKVEMFAIGFPPILFGFKRVAEGFRIRILPGFFAEKEREEEEGDEDDEGAADDAVEVEDSLWSHTFGCKGAVWDTEYCLGLIPVGGFVKMLGQEDTGAAKSTDDPRSFANKSVAARMAVVAAGVVCNVILAVIIFIAVFLIGINRPPAVVGGVEPNSPAMRAGLQAGDEIIEIDGKSDNIDITDVMLAAGLSGRGEAVSMKVDRGGVIKDFEIVAEKRNGGDLKTFGINMPETLTVDELADQADVNDLRAKTGLAPGDRITQVGGKEVSNHWDLAPIVERTYSPTVKLSAERAGNTNEPLTVYGEVKLGWAFAEEYKIASESQLYHIHSMVPRLRVVAYAGMPEPVSLPVKVGRGVKSAGRWALGKVGSLFGKTGKKKVEDEAAPALLAGDVILSASGVENPTYLEMREVVQGNKDKPVRVVVLRTDANGAEEQVAVSITPRGLPDSDWVQMGVMLELDADHAVVAGTVEAGVGIGKLDIPRGALITAVDGEPVSSFYDVVRQIGKYPGEHITIEYRIDDETAGAVALTVSTEAEAVSVKAGFSDFIPFKRMERLYKASGPIDAVRMGARKTVALIAQTYLTLRRLIVGAVSPKNLIGPVGILSVSYQTVARQMWIEYLFLIGLINAAIAVFNFLPMPPLDGGLAAFLVVEKVKGSAVSERTQGVVVRIGLAIVLVLFVYITLNDVIRNFFS
ncbi:MAG: site-2 protease family protein [Sedimentisphaerales bacterium]|nr:site-2 protease family protein [Sedimentisphaerales bacterium]